MSLTDQELFDGFDQYQVARGFTDSTRRRRRVGLRQFGRFMDPKSVTAAKPADIDEWLARHTSPGTRLAYYNDVAAFFRWAQRRELIDYNPFLQTDPPKKPKSVPKPARAATIETALLLANGPTQLMILLGALAGLRVSEIAALSTNCVFLDREPPVLVVDQGKGGKDRIVPLHPVLVDRLRTVKPGWLFPSLQTNREHISGNRVGELVGRALTAASEGQHVTCHQLRHYFGTEAAKWSRGNVILVAGLMGHEDPKTTFGYIEWDQATGAEVVSRIGSGGRVDVPDELAQRRGRGAS